MLFIVSFYFGPVAQIHWGLLFHQKKTVLVLRTIKEILYMYVVSYISPTFSLFCNKGLTTAWRDAVRVYLLGLLRRELIAVSVMITSSAKRLFSLSPISLWTSAIRKWKQKSSLSLSQTISVSKQSELTSKNHKNQCQKGLFKKTINYWTCFHLISRQTIMQIITRSINNLLQSCLSG